MNPNAVEHRLTMPSAISRKPKSIFRIISQAVDLFVQHPFIYLIPAFVFTVFDYVCTLLAANYLGEDFWGIVVPAVLKITALYTAKTIIQFALMAPYIMNQAKGNSTTLTDSLKITIARFPTLILVRIAQGLIIVSGFGFILIATATLTGLTAAIGGFIVGNFIAVIFAFVVFLPTFVVIFAYFILLFYPVPYLVLLEGFSAAKSLLHSTRMMMTNPGTSLVTHPMIRYILLILPFFLLAVGISIMWSLAIIIVCTLFQIDNSLAITALRLLSLIIITPIIPIVWITSVLYYLDLWENPAVEPSE